MHGTYIFRACAVAVAVDDDDGCGGDEEDDADSDLEAAAPPYFILSSFKMLLELYWNRFSTPKSSPFIVLS